MQNGQPKTSGCAISTRIGTIALSAIAGKQVIRHVYDGCAGYPIPYGMILAIFSARVTLFISPDQMERILPSLSMKKVVGSPWTL